MQKIKFSLLTLMVLFGLLACGDETTINENSTLDIIGEGESLGKCTNENAGDMVFVTDSNAVFYCANGSWRTLNGKDGADGADGKDGTDGKDGADGVSSSDSSIVEDDDGVQYLVDSRDDQKYRIVTVGRQVWMAENLNYAYLQPTAELDSSSFCYGNVADSCAKYGRLYLWSAAMDSAAVFSEGGEGCGYDTTCSISGTVRGICPEGWHLPSDTEWDTLFAAVGGKDSAETMLKSTSGWYNNGNGEDSYGFSVLPAGYRNYNNGVCRNVGDEAVFWSSSENSGESSRESAGTYHFYFSADEYRTGSNKGSAYSVRCVRNSDDEESAASSSSSQTLPSSSSISVISPFSVIKGTVKDDRDGNTYKTVTIGTQTWMAENLNYAYLQPTAKQDSSSFCYGNVADSCAKYGRLYLWSAAIDSAGVFSDDRKGCDYDTTCIISRTARGVCPEGWHLPSDTEWETLFTAIGGRDSAGTMLKSTSGWYNNGNGEDSYGFTVLPAGHNNNDVGVVADFWSSTDHGSDQAFEWDFYYSRASVSHGFSLTSNTFSVRCVKDSDGEN